MLSIWLLWTLTSGGVADVDSFMTQESCQAAMEHLRQVAPPPYTFTGCDQPISVRSPAKTT